MNRILTILCVVLLVLAAGCSDDEGGGGTTNNSAPDGGTPDGGAPDSWTADEIRLDSIHPVQGPTGGGTEVTISGVGFSPDAQVFFGDDEAQSASFVSAYEISATTPRVEQAGSVDVVVEFIGGERRELADAFEFFDGEPVRSVGWCNVQHPAQTEVTEGSQTESIFGRVYVENCTEGDTRCDAVTAQLGWGAGDVDPSSQPDQWNWLDADHNADHTGDENDEYEASIAPLSVGEYFYAYRFSVDDGATWTYCDLDGSDNGFSTTERGELFVVHACDDPEPPVVSWCNLQHPAQTTTTVGEATDPIYGRVGLDNCDDCSGPCDDVNVDAQVGVGPQGADPGADPGDFDWVDAALNPDHDTDDNYEYEATLTPSDAGTYSYAYRFRADGASWAYCDLDGSDNGFETAQMGELTVEEETTPDPVDIGWCNLQHPAQTTTTAGDPTELIYGRVYSDNCTGGGQQCDGITAQVGFGPQGTDPTAAAASFTWADADFNAGHDTDDNDEYEGVLTPPNPGTYRYVYRFSGDDGASWTYCDQDGSDNGFQTDQMGDLTVDP
jgi:hypothetical protein